MLRTYPESVAAPTYAGVMSARRVMGIETEYGISVPGDPAANPMVLSGLVVNAYASVQGIRLARASWDYEDEAPLRDARGFDLSRQLADASQLTDEEDPTLANVVLTNGARLYVDHAHPEYSSPEVTSPRAAVRWDRAGEQIMLESVRRLAAVPGGRAVNLYKNNTDGKGASYGTHENYLMRRETPFADICRHLIPFFVVRQVICGAGRVGIGPDSSMAGYQISQRADFFEVEVGLETTLKRPIINTRDEPHAVADRYRRLHVIIGDANLCDVSNLLKLGTTSLVLAMIEARAIDADLAVRHPVSTLHAVSHDPSLTALVELRSGQRLTAVQLLWRYYELVERFLAQDRGEPDPDTVEVMDRWASVLTRLERGPMECAREIDWVAKLAVLQGYRDRDGLEWSDPRLGAVDIQWSDVRPEKGIARRMEQRGRIERIVEQGAIDEAVASPPNDTRAYFRGRCLDKYASEVAAASWDSVIFDLPGHQALQRVPMLEPLRGTQESVGALIDRSATAEDLLHALAAAAG